jgi:hypothetical protein
MYAIKEFVFEFLSCTSGQQSGPQALLYSRDRARLYRDLQLKLLPIHHGAKPLMPLEDSTKFEGCRPGGYFYGVLSHPTNRRCTVYKGGLFRLGCPQFLNF